MARLGLWIRCATCGETFDTGIRMDRRNFARATFASNYHTCPRCRGRGTYHKEDYLLRDDPERRTPHPREA
jgi:DNA-directed RNA polymerase subunit RPC12/RpoP